MRRHNRLRLAAATLGATLPALFAAACAGDSPSAPSAAPSAALGGTSLAVEDGEPTLKAEPPVPLSPTQGIQLENRQPVFQFANSPGIFVDIGFAYQLQVLAEHGQVIYDRTIGQGDGETTHEYPGDPLLESDTPYQWRVRAVLALAPGQVAHGPWSDPGAFRTAFLPTWPACPQPMSSGGGNPHTPDMFHRVVEIAATSEHWAMCQVGAGPFHGGLACHLFTREVALALHMEDPNWGLLTKNPGEWGCTETACGSALNCHLAEDIVMHRGSGRLIDIIIGAGSSNAQLSWQSLPLGGKRPTNHWTGPQ